MPSPAVGTTVPLGVWLGLLPAMLGATYFIGGLAAYAGHVRLHGETEGLDSVAHLRDGEGARALRLRL